MVKHEVNSCFVLVVVGKRPQVLISALAWEFALLADNDIIMMVYNVQTVWTVYLVQTISP